MTLAAVFHLDEYILFVGDNRLWGIWPGKSRYNLDNHEFITDNFAKLKEWRAGTLVLSGSLLLANFVYEGLQGSHENNTIDIFQIALTARNKFLSFYAQRKGPAVLADCTIFFSVVTPTKTELFELYIEPDQIHFKTLQPGDYRIALFSEHPNPNFYQNLFDKLKPASEFDSLREFYNYHVTLIRTFYAAQKKIDPVISDDFEVCFENCATGKKLFVKIDKTHPEPSLQTLFFLGNQKYKMLF